MYILFSQKEKLMDILVRSKVNMYPSSDWVTQNKEDYEGSEDSNWSEIDNPGESTLDKIIDKKTRFNLHYHKEEIVDIP